MNIAVAQSGGPTCVINASLLGVAREAMRSGRVERVYGAWNGIEGVLEDRLLDLTALLADAHSCALLRQTPGAALGSCRRKLPDPAQDDTVYRRIADRFAQYGIEAFFYIGGNDSMDTTAKLSAWFAAQHSPVRVIGVPKTIDNDLMYTDHTPGFGSAARYLAVTMQEIIRDSTVYNLPSVTIVEIMGRNAGWLTASCCVLRENGEQAPQLIYLPEGKFGIRKFIDDVRAAQRQHKAVIAAVSEGVDLSGSDPGVEYQSGATDVFGHKYLSGVGKLLERATKQELGCKVRSIELNVMQRCSSHIASETDLCEAEQIGAAAVQAALRGETGRMMVFRRESDAPYRVVVDSVPAADAANGEKKFPVEWITPAQNNICDEAIPYFLPLIQGNPTLLYRNGLPEVLRLI